MWSLDVDSSLPLWRPTATPDRPGLAFTTRRGGTSDPPYDTLNLGRSTEDRPQAVAENRRLLLAALGRPFDSIATAGQVHGSTVVEVTHPGHHPDCDALVTRARGVTLCVTTADCLPILYVAPVAVAAAHSGWRGTADGMPGTALRAISTLAAVPAAELQVHLGPCIRACCYEVGLEVARRFPAAVTTRTATAWRLDLAAAARLQLLEAGVPATSIEDVGACTSCEPFWYYSHRRDRGRAGRHWAIAHLPQA